MRLTLLFIILALTTPTDWSSLDAIIQQAIAYRAFPGAVISVGNQNGILYTKAYGTTTYQEDVYQQPVRINTKYDIASVTKVLGTTAAIMHLVQDGKIKLNDLVSKYIPEYDSNQKRNTTITHLLMHSAGLKYDYPGPLPSTPQQVYNYIYFCKPENPVGTKFSYSNLGFVVLHRIVEIVTNRTIIDYYHQNQIIMGLTSTGFNPKPEEYYNIAPTEYDTQLRHKIIRGEPHERLSYFLGGAAGHSGYFSTASDLLQFVRILGSNGKLLNKPRVYSQDIVKTFTTKVPVNYSSSMALGFDTSCPGNLMKDCFGHHGSTGCSAWTDRASNISFGLVNNRGHPNVNNNLFWEYIPKIANQIMKALGYTDDNKQ